MFTNLTHVLNILNKQNKRWQHDWCKNNHQKGITSFGRPPTCKHSGSSTHGWWSTACHLLRQYDVRNYQSRAGFTGWPGNRHEKRYNHCVSNRPKQFHDLSLEQYFYRVFIRNTFKQTKKDELNKDADKDAVTSNEQRILVFKGMNCTPKYPIDFAYARGMLILHKPWSKDNTLTSILKDHQKTISTFLSMIDKKEVPSSV